MRGVVPKIGRSLIGASLFAAFAFTLVLSVSPQLHERLHPKAKTAGHECAVTLIAAGKYEHSTAAPLLVAPVPALHFSVIPALRPVWVASPFLGARIFEHAPPAIA